MKRWLAASAILLAASTAGAQTPQKTLRVEDVVDVVRTRSAVAGQIDADRRAAAGEVRSASGGFDPVLRGLAGAVLTGEYPLQRYDLSIEQTTALYGLSAFAGWRRGTGTIPVYDGKIATNAWGEVRGGLRLPLLRDGSIDRRRALVARAELGRDVVKDATDQQRIDLARTASVRYWEWVAAGLRAAASERWLALAEARDAQLVVRAEKGDLATIDRDDNRRAVEQRRAQLAAHRRDAVQLGLELGALLVERDGTAPMLDAASAPKDLPEPPPIDERPDDAIQRALASRPDLRALGGIAQQVDVDARLADNQRLPGLDVTVAASRDFGAGVPDRARVAWETWVTLEFPLLQRTAAGRLDVARAQAEKVRLTRAVLAERIRRDVLSARAALDAAKERTQAARAELALAKKLREAEQRKFAIGEGSLVILNLREQAEVEAALREVDALLDWQRAFATYRAVTGG